MLEVLKKHDIMEMTKPEGFNLLFHKEEYSMKIVLKVTTLVCVGVLIAIGLLFLAMERDKSWFYD